MAAGSFAVLWRRASLSDGEFAHQVGHAVVSAGLRPEFYWDVRSSDPGPLFILISQHITTPKSDPFAAVFDVVKLL